MEYFQNNDLLQNTLLPYFCNEVPLKLINKQFSQLNYEKYMSRNVIETFECSGKSRINYKNGRYDGLYEYWYKNGQSKLRINYKNGRHHGLYEEWYDNGQLWIRKNYKDGWFDGLYERWYYTGELLETCNFVDDKLKGLYVMYYKNGEIEYSTEKI